MKKHLFLLFVLFVSLHSAAQDRKLAAKLFDAGNFESALEEYSLLQEKKPNDLLYNYRLGVCYLNTNISKAKAIPFLEKVCAQPKHDPNARYLLGRAYHLNGEYDKAIAAYSKFLEIGGGTWENLKDAGRQIDYCQNAKELVKFPLKVTFENLGKTVNSAYPDYLPFLPVNESFILFTTRRNDGSSERMNGGYYSNIYISNTENGKFQKAVPLDNINTKDQDENIVGLSNSGDVAILYTENPDRLGDLMFLPRRDGQFLTPLKIDEKINTRYTEIAASISSDSSSIFFASNMPGGFGGIDIYVSRRLPNGKWSDPQNLGPSVNTLLDEDFPSISPDGMTLYFSSKGHTSMGGYDLFRAEYNPEKNRYMNVRSLGYPINTPGDDMNFRVSEDGKYGYLAAVRPEGNGDLDIYKVTFEDVESRYTVCKGYISSSDSTLRPEATFITVTDLSTGELFGEYQPNQKSLRYVMILPPGRYSIFVESEGFSGKMETLEIFGQSDYRFEITRDIQLQPER